MNFFSLHANNFVLFLPEIFLATSILVLTLSSSFLVTSKHLGYPLLTRSLSNISLLILFLTFLITKHDTVVFSQCYQSTFIFDGLTLTVKEVLLISSFFCLLIFENYLIKAEINSFEYFILILCSILGLMFLVSSFDMISLYLAIEMQSLCLYVLAAGKKDSTLSTEASLKYFILGSFSSALLLFGISIIYGCTGSTNFSHFYLLFSEEDIETLSQFGSIQKAIFCISAAFFFKIASAPFHMWLPDVYEGSPTSSTIFFAVVPKIALFTIFSRFFLQIFAAFEESFLFLFAIFPIASVIVGSFVALRQRKLKRLFAYSSISHVGYLLLAIASNSLEATQSLFFYLFVYMLTSLCIWSVLLSLVNSSNIEKSKTVVDLASTAKDNPLLGFTAVLGMFSLAGVPPLVGFFAKMEIFVCALNSSLFFSSIVAILSSVISSFYYIRLVKAIYFEARIDSYFVFPVDRQCSLVLGSSVFFLVYFFVNPTLLLLASQKMALCLF